MNETESSAFEVEAVAEGESRRLSVTRAGGGETRHYRLAGGEQQHYTPFYRQLARDFGMRIPHERHKPAPSGGGEPPWRPLLSENLSPQILAGYGDPAVLKTGEPAAAGLCGAGGDAARPPRPDPR